MCCKLCKIKLLIDKFTHLNRIEISQGVKIDFKVLSNCSQLVHLDVFGTMFSKGDVESMSNLKNLVYLNLGATNIQNESMKSLSQLSKLETLDLWHTEITQEGLDKISESLPNLTRLNLAYTKLNINIFSSFAHFSKLRYLDLGNTCVGPIVLKSLQHLTELKSLFLDHTDVSDMDLRFTYFIFHILHRINF